MTASDQWKKDANKKNNFKILNYDFIEFWEYDINNNINEIKNTIINYINAR